MYLIPVLPSIVRTNENIVSAARKLFVLFVFTVVNLRNIQLTASCEHVAAVLPLAVTVPHVFEALNVCEFNRLTKRSEFDCEVDSDRSLHIDRMARSL